MLCAVSAASPLPMKRFAAPHRAEAKSVRTADIHGADARRCRRRFRFFTCAARADCLPIDALISLGERVFFAHGLMPDIFCRSASPGAARVSRHAFSPSMLMFDDAASASRRSYRAF